MEVTGANPFLMGGDEPSPQSTLNPFLMGDDSFAAPDPSIDNPFFSSQIDTSNVTFGNNPFAFDPSDYAPAVTTAAELFGAIVETNTFTSAEITPQQPAIIQQNLLDNDDITDNTSSALPQTSDLFMSAAPIVQKPTDLDLQNKTSEVLAESNEDLFGMDNGQSGPRRPPPPPRPTIPSSTKDLILSVTGAMDATSSHLLDRIPPTRTPSPVSMRDLHSPSPTPDQNFGDLVDVSSGLDDMSQNFESVQPESNETQKQPDMNFFDLNDTTSDLLGDINLMSSAPTTTAIDPFNSIMTVASTAPTLPPVSSVPIIPTVPSVPSIPSVPPITSVPTPIPSVPPVPVVSDINQNQPVEITQPVAPKQPSRPPPPQKPPPPRVPPPPSRPPAPEIVPQQPKPQEVFTSNTYQPPPRPVVPEIPKTNDLDFMMSNTSLPQPPPPRPSEPVVPVAQPKVNDFSLETSETRNEATILETEIQKDTIVSPDAQSNNSNINPFSLQDEVPKQVVIPDLQNVNNNQFNEFDNTPAMSVSVTSNVTYGSSAFDSSDKQDIFGSSSVTSPPLESFPPPRPTNYPNVTSTVNTTGDIFGSAQPVDNANTGLDAFDSAPPKKSILQTFQKQSEDFDAFAMKFESTAKDTNKNAFDPFGGAASASDTGDAWGNAFGNETKEDVTMGFGAEEPFDSFLSLTEPPPVPQGTPMKLSRGDSDSDEDKDFSVVIKPKNLDFASNLGGISSGFVPTLAPPPKSPIQSSISDTSPRINPFDQQDDFTHPMTLPQDPIGQLERTDSQETPPTPLYDEDTSQPLEDFPRINYEGEGWEMQLRQPNKKKITGQRFWKKIFLRLIYQGDNPVLQLFNAQGDKDPFQELPLQACYSVSEIGAQQYDQYGKIFTIKLQYVFYKERPGVRPGQVTKAERITNKLSQFAAYAIQGDYQGVKEFGSDLKKLGLPVEHAPQISQLFKIGSQTYEHMKEFSMTVEEALFRLTVHRDRALHYKMEEVQITLVDELYVEQNAEGGVDKQIARVRLFFLGFLSGMPDIELGVNDMRRQGKEVVGRHDIIPVVTEEWIRLENVEFHACVQQEEYHKTHIIRFKPPDACYIELMRFRVRPPKNRELPLQLKATMCVTGNKVELRADVLVPGFASRKLGQVPCEDVMIRFPIPECWIYLFRVEKHFRYGSVKSAHRRTGKIKGIERFLGTVETLQESLIEVTSGQAKYEHQHRAIVWRCPRLPKEGQGAYTTHNLVCRMALTSYDQIPEQLAEYCYVEFTMPATQVSHTTCRSVSVQGSDSDEPPEKYVRYLARHEYRVGIEHTKGDGPGAYTAATITRPAPIPEATSPAAAVAPAAVSSDSDSD